MRHEQACNIDLITAKIESMTTSCNFQKNVNMTIKNGLNKIRDLVYAIDRDHKAATKKEESYRTIQKISKECRQDQKPFRNYRRR